VHPVEAAQQVRGTAPHVDDVDAQGAGVGADRREGLSLGAQKLSGAWQQGLTVERGEGAAWRACEEADPEIALEDRDSLGDALLGDPQPSRCAHLKSLVAPEQLLTANSRFESTTWSAMIVGPPLGGAAIGLVGSVATITADALSYLLSALGIRMIGGHESPPPKADGARPSFRDLSGDWRYILTHARLRPVIVNVVVVNGTIMATEPLLAVLLLRNLHYHPWQYGLAFAAPCIGGLAGSRLARPLVIRGGTSPRGPRGWNPPRRLAGRTGLRPRGNRRSPARHGA
jgi:hypothetical protein